MEEFGIVTHCSKFNLNKKLPVWRVAKEGSVILQHFYIDRIASYSPKKIQLVSAENAEFKISPITFDLEFDYSNRGYKPHYLGHTLDMVKTKTCIIFLEINAPNENEDGNESFHMMFTDLGNDGNNNFFCKPIPGKPAYLHTPSLIFT